MHAAGRFQHNKKFCASLESTITPWEVTSRIHGQEFLEKCCNFLYIVIKVCTLSTRRKSGGYFNEFEVSKKREMERDNGLRANLGSARHDAVSENAAQGHISEIEIERRDR